MGEERNNCQNSRDRESRFGETAPVCGQVLPASLSGKPERISCVRGKEGNANFRTWVVTRRPSSHLAATVFFCALCDCGEMRQHRIFQGKRSLKTNEVARCKRIT